MDGDAKGMAQLYTASNNLLVLTAINNGPLKTDEGINKETLIDINASDVYAIVQKKDGKKYMQEFYWGNSYLSNSSRRLMYNAAWVSSVTVYDNKGNKREVKMVNK